MNRHEVLWSGLVAAAASGIPSTTWTLATGGDVLEGARAAGTLLAPRARSTPVLLVAAVPAHLALSLGWAAVLAALLPRGREPLYGPVAALGIAALDLEVIGRRFPAIRALPQPRQWADHVAYGLAVGLVLRCHRSIRAPTIRRRLGYAKGMTRSTETGQITGTRDKDYDLIWFTEQCMSNALRMEQYAQDAERDGDNELADFFRRAQGESRKGAEQGKSMLTKRLGGS